MCKLTHPLRLVWLIVGGGLLVTAISMAGCAGKANSSASGVSQTPSEPLFTPPVTEEPQGQIAFVGDDGNLQLLGLPSGQLQALTKGEHITSPAWSPDGTQLACVHEIGSDSSHEIMLLDMVSQTQRTFSALRDPMLANVSWSPDGRYLVGDVGCCASGRVLVLLDADGQVQRRIPYSFRYAWSPDGRYLALGREVSLDQPIPIETGNSTSVVVLDVASGAEQVVAQGTPEALYSPACWLSEKILVYRQLLWKEANQQGQHQLWQVVIDDPLKSVEPRTDLPSDCTGSVAITMLPAELREGAGKASWSPDKQWLVVSVTQDRQPSIYLIQSISYAVRRMAAGTEPVWRPTKLQ